MDIDRILNQVPATKPLLIHKKPSHVSFTAQLSDNNPYKNYSPSPPPPIWPKRTSSICKTDSYNESIVSDKSPQVEAAVTQSTPSEWTDYLSDSDTTTPTRSEHSTVSDIKDLYISNSPSTPSDIIGNFIPIPSPGMDSRSSAQENGKEHAMHASAKVVRAAHAATNPYEFDPESPFVAFDPRHETRFEDFIPRDVLSDGQPRPLHVKNTRSTSNAPMATPAKEAIGYRMQRSESSPSMTPGRFTELRTDERRITVDSPKMTGTWETSALSRRGRSPSRARPQHNKYGEVIEQHQGSGSYDTGTQSPTRLPMYRKTRDIQSGSGIGSSNTFQGPSSYAAGSRSPTRLPMNGKPRDNNSGLNTARPRSPTKTLDDVEEHDESVMDSPLPPSLTEPKKRSRSPMKKMFGEHGWLGRTPNELQDIKHPKESPSSRKEKPSMMGKLMTKLGEFAEKAELSPHRSSRSSDKPPKLSVLSVSLSAPEQAKIYMELELMVVISANSFLMNQFSQGRIAVDTIKKTVDTWKSKGRPVVIEFMYDQGTQRDLVAANQHNFRFYGERAGDSMRINSMLYNWKTVASLMSVRTLCNADTVILKLLFDIEQILELLGAREPIVLRLQQLRTTANETMRIERQKRATNSTSSQSVANGIRRETWNSRSSVDDTGTLRSRPSIDDQYGGLKLVPDSYTEN